MARPPAASARVAVELAVELLDPSLAPALVATGARLGAQVRVSAGATPLMIAPEDTLAHVVRSEVLAGVDGSVDLETAASARARRALEGLAGAASSKSAAIVREEPDGRMSLHLRDRLPVDLGEPPEAAAAMRSARARKLSARLAAREVQIPDGAEARARAITFGPSRTLSDPSSRRVLEAFGIHAAAWRLAENAARAAAHARVLGYPIDLRVASPDVSAIDEPRFSALELRAPGEVREGFRAIAREVRRLSPSARSLGVTVSRHVPGAPRLRLSLERGTPDRLRIALDDAIGRRLTRPLVTAIPTDASSAASALAIFEGRDVLPDLDTASGRALLEVLVRFSRLSLVLADTLTGAEIAPLAPLGDSWVVLGTRLSVRGVDVATGS
ncbi:MAG: acetate--CoA ligase family protein [Deltaproteobacteria bacterium]|nr:acetate--CoA ligase family protein [Deltaproteobacteria bacterium]